MSSSDMPGGGTTRHNTAGYPSPAVASKTSPRPSPTSAVAYARSRLAAPYHWLQSAWIAASGKRVDGPPTYHEEGTRESSPSTAPRAAEHRMQSHHHYYVIPEDVHAKSLMADDSRWCEEGTAGPPAGVAAGREGGGPWAWCGGPPLSYFHKEYFAPGELFPLGSRRFYDLRLPVPNHPWALLRRAYGGDCGHIARLNEQRAAQLARCHQFEQTLQANIEQMQQMQQQVRRRAVALDTSFDACVGRLSGAFADAVAKRRGQQERAGAAATARPVLR